MGRTDGGNGQVNVRTEDLVPSEDGVDEVARAWEAGDAAEGVGEGDVACAICLESFCLLGRGALGKEVDDTFDIADWISRQSGLA